MAYDEELAERVRSALASVKGVTEIRMFGGLCYTVRGNMAVGVNGDALMVRMSPDDGDAALSEPGARPMDFTHRPTRGFLFVGPQGTTTDRSLRGWVDRGVAFASSVRRRSRRRRRPRSPRPDRRGLGSDVIRITAGGRAIC